MPLQNASALEMHKADHKEDSHDMPTGRVRNSSFRECCVSTEETLLKAAGNGNEKMRMIASKGRTHVLAVSSLARPVSLGQGDLNVGALWKHCANYGVTLRALPEVCRSLLVGPCQLRRRCQTGCRRWGLQGDPPWLIGRVLGGSWLVISRVISGITIVITHNRGLIAPLITIHEPPSIA